MRLEAFLQELEEPRWDRALAAYTIAYALRPDHSEVLHRRAMALEALGRTDEAIESYQRGLDVDPDGGDVHLNLANALHDSGERQQALEHHGRAVELCAGQ